MSEHVLASDLERWECAKCGIPLVLGKVDVSYLNSSYQVDLLHCPKCGMVFVSEDLAVGKMAELEKSLEDK